MRRGYDVPNPFADCDDLAKKVASRHCQLVQNQRTIFTDTCGSICYYLSIVLCRPIVRSASTPFMSTLSSDPNHIVLQMSDSLQHLLKRTEDKFLSSLNEGAVALRDFDNTFSELQNAMNAASTKNEMDEDTLATACQVLHRIQTIAAVFIDLCDSSQSVSEAFQLDLSNIFRELRITEEPDNMRSTGEDLFFCERLVLFYLENSVVVHPRPPYILPAYTWLLHNLHHPYPSSKVKTSLASKTGSPRKDINDWFIDVRKRIGWTTLCKTEFANKRSSIVAAATQFFKGSKNGLTNKAATYEAFFTHFARISANAESLYPDLMASISTSPLYSSRFETNTLAEKHHRSWNTLARGRPRQLLVANPYLSPSSSPSSSRNNSPCPSQDIKSSMKRRRSGSCESTDCGSIKKRGRSVVCLLTQFSVLIFGLNYRYISEASAIKSLPSPPASPPDTGSPDDQEISAPPTLTKRKRCLSDADDRVHKRLHSAPAPHKLQSVSNPVYAPGLSDTEIEEIPEFSSAFPEPVNVQSFDDNTPLELEYFHPYFSDIQLSEAPSTDEKGTFRSCPWSLQCLMVS
jgi:hypothetical protein